MADQKTPPEAPKPEPSFEEKYAKEIAAKITAGLRREDAILVIKHQLENDAAKKPAKK